MSRRKNCCRFCLEPCTQKDASLKDGKLVAMLRVVFTFQLDALGMLPESICSVCNETVTKFYEFCLKVQANQSYLKNATEDSLYAGDAAEIKIEYPNWMPDPIDDASTEELEKNVTAHQAKPDNVCLERTPSPELLKIKVEDLSLSPDISVGSPTIEMTLEDGCDNALHESSLDESAKDDSPEHTSPAKHSELPANTDKQMKDQMLAEFFSMNCSTCSQSFKTFKLLKSHCQREHGQKSVYVSCCNKKFFHRWRMLEHLKEHCNPDQYRCEMCDKTYTNRDYFKQHLRQAHAAESEKQYKCDRCGQSFIREYLLRSHMRRHIQVQCRVCEKVLSNSSSLRTHMLSVHSNEDRCKICDTCGQKFVSNACFERHVKSHQGATAERVQCTLCNRWLMGRYGLKSHIRTVHEERTLDIRCDICQQRYPSKRSLVMHKKRVHVERAFQCQFCDKSFKRELNLLEHRTIHTGEILYSCDHCSVTTNSKANLYTHKKRMHQAEWLESKVRKESHKRGSEVPKATGDK